MRSASPALATFLATTRQAFVADLVTLTLRDGVTSMRFTNFDLDLTAGGQLYLAGLPFKRTKVKLSVGVDVDTLTLTLHPDPARHALLGRPWPAAAADGVLDGARVLVDRAFMAEPGDTAALGTLRQFGGRVGEVQPSRTTVVLQVRSDLELLNAPLPRNVYQAGCLHTLYDGGCGLARASFARTGTVGAGSTARQIVAASVAGGPYADGWFDLGAIRFTSGALTGVTRAVRRWEGGTIAVALPLRQAPAAGDAFELVPGCDKTLATCQGKFANVTRFRGFPFTPKPETLR